MASEQRAPQGDERYRTNRSVRFYVGEVVCGSGECTWYFNESAERVIYLFPDKVEKVVYKGRYYELLTPKSLKSIIRSQIKSGGYVHIGGKSISQSDADISYRAHPFINISSDADMKFHRSNLARAGRIKN